MKNKKVYIAIAVLVVVLAICIYFYYTYMGKDKPIEVTENVAGEDQGKIEVSEDELDSLRAKPGSIVDDIYNQMEEDKKEFESAVTDAYESDKVSTQEGDMTIITKYFRDFELYTLEGGTAVFNIETGNYAYNETMKLELRPYVESTGSTSILIKDTLGFKLKPREEFTKDMFMTLVSSNRSVGIKAEQLKYLNYKQAGDLEIATGKTANIIYELKEVQGVKSISILNPTQWRIESTLYRNGVYVKGNFLQEYSFVITDNNNERKEIRLNKKYEDITILFEDGEMRIYTGINVPIEDYTINNLD